MCMIDPIIAEVTRLVFGTLAIFCLLRSCTAISQNTLQHLFGYLPAFGFFLFLHTCFDRAVTNPTLGLAPHNKAFWIDLVGYSVMCLIIAAIYFLIGRKFQMKNVNATRSNEQFHHAG